MNFYEIPSSLRKPGPYTEINTKMASAGLASGVQKVLFVGPLMSTSTLAAGTVAMAFTDADVADLCGAGGVLHIMARAAFRVNPDIRLSVVGYADAGTKATWDLTLTGATITAPATLRVMIGNDSILVDMAIGDTPAALVTKITAAINTYLALPVTAIGGTGKTTLTFKNGGVIGNITISCSLTAACGITFAVAPVVVGAGDPSMATVLSLAAGSRWHIVATPYSDATKAAELKSYIATVSTPLEKKPGVVVMAFMGTIANAIALSGGILYNRVTIGMVKSSISPAYELAGAYAGAISTRDDPSRPLKGIVLTGCAAPTVANNLTRIEQETLLSAGVSPFELNAAGELSLVRAVSTEITGYSAKSPDLWIRIADYIRDCWNLRVETNFGDSKLNDITLGALADAAYDTAKRLEAPEVQITENVDKYKELFTAVRGQFDTTRADVRFPADPVPGLNIVCTSIELY